MGNKEVIKIDFSSKSAAFGVWLYTFKDDSYHIAFIPSLNLTGYGATEKEASDMLFGEVLEDFIGTLFSIPESKVTEELTKLGWKRSKLLRKKFYNTPYIDREGVLKNFNLPEETPIKSTFVDA
ncbi:MAG TPA: hypothetical protein VKZ75_01435 [Cyclobacteriaceae bacterium]|jgi:hypothetical protein|nr:hypothetical protein [Cyclobacteriaceae bacterium]